MRKRAIFGLALTVLLVSSDAAGDDRRLLAKQTDAGLSVSYPAGWRWIGHPLTNCSDPVEVIDLAGPGGALFMLQETGSRNLPRRPERFRLVGKASPLGCCTPTSQPGWVIPFREDGREFYAYLYPGSLDQRDEVLAILNSLEVSPR